MTDTLPMDLMIIQIHCQEKMSSLYLYYMETKSINIIRY